jgi:hypothetical protein
VRIGVLAGLECGDSMSAAINEWLPAVVRPKARRVELTFDYRPTAPATNPVIGVLDQPARTGHKCSCCSTSAPIGALNQALVQLRRGELAQEY